MAGSGYDAGVRVIAGPLVGVASAILIVVVAVVPFLSPPWIAFEQGRAEATAWTGFTTEELNAATGAILADLMLGPPEFDVEVRGEPVLTERERGHMRNVRDVFSLLWIAAGAAIVVLVVTFARADRGVVWRAVQRGAIGLGAAVVGLGVFALVAFELLFEIFHRVFFAAGTYTFDPRTERLVQLFPFRFWQETATAVGVVIVVLSAIVAILAGRRPGPAQPTATELSPAPAVR